MASSTHTQATDNISHAQAAYELAHERAAGALGPQPGQAPVGARRGGPIVTTRRYAAGDEIFAPGSGSGTVHRVCEGFVRLYKVLHDGRSINLTLLGPGEYFSREQAENGYASGVIAEALAPTTLELIDRAGFDARLAADPRLALALIDSQARQLVTLYTLVEHLLARDTGVRLATTLLQLAESFGRRRADGRVTIDLPITHQALANMIGSNRVTVTRKLLEFQESRAFQAEGRNKLTVDTNALREVAELA